ncbi:DNA alkylation repair protein [Caldicellulosiruptoraceae bacterium PP1]
MGIIEIFYSARNEENAEKMSAYMKNKFSFLGIPKPLRATLSKDFLIQKKMEKEIDWEFIFNCYNMPEREFHYLALDYLNSVKELLQPDDMYKIEKLIITNSWWDSVDYLDTIVGYLCLKYPELKDSFIIRWIDSENIWLKRISINFQLQYKEKTDTTILSQAILKNCDTKEFFINKAIGWALRQYSKTNKEWVKQFLTNNKLHPLSVKEASKYL